MHLGTLLSRLADDTNAADAIAALGDLVLYADVEAMGASHGETPGQYLAGAARRFADRADHESWLALMDAMGRSDDPAQAALAAMLKWSLARDRTATLVETHSGCRCGSGDCHDSA